MTRAPTTSLAATRHLLARDGYDQVSIDAIAKGGRRQPADLPPLAIQGARGVHAAFGEPGDRMPIGARGSRPDHEFVRGTVEFWGEPVVRAAALGIPGRPGPIQIRSCRSGPSSYWTSRPAGHSLHWPGAASTRGALRADLRSARSPRTAHRIGLLRRPGPAPDRHHRPHRGNCAR